MHARSIRAAALLAMAAGSCAMLGPSIAPVHAATPAASPNSVRAHHPYQGYLTAAPTSTAAPTTLTV